MAKDKDTRKKDANWKVKQREDGTYHVEYVQIAILLDIRDELKAIRKILDAKGAIKE